MRSTCLHGVPRRGSTRSALVSSCAQQWRAAGAASREQNGSEGSRSSRAAVYVNTVTEQRTTKEQFLFNVSGFLHPCHWHPELAAMNSDYSSRGHAVVTYTYDASGRLIDRREASAAALGAAPDDATVEAASLTLFAFEHDKQKRLFILKRPDGKVEHFRDNPVRQLLVEPDPETGEMRPVIQRGQPVYLYLCREEREL